ncbi:MAG: alanine racemase, partial [Myxococcota bacterium]
MSVALIAEPRTTWDAWPRDSSGELLVGGRPLSVAVKAVGGTPCYLYDRERLTQRYELLRKSVPARTHFHYAIKANPMPAVVCHMARLVEGLDVASAGELRVALDSGMVSDRISFAGPGKTVEELEQAVAAGVLINVESFREIRILTKISEQLGVTARVAVRANLPFELRASGMKMAGGARQFGIDAEYMPDMLDKIAASGLNFEGFHLFAGSQNLKASAIVEAQTKSYELALQWCDLAPGPLRSLNLGGGFGIQYNHTDKPLDI